MQQLEGLKEPEPPPEELEPEPLHARLAYCVVALAAIRNTVEEDALAGDANETVCVYERARDALHKAFAVFGEIRKAEGADETVCVCERDGASLHATQGGLYHAVNGKGDVLVEDEHEYEGDLGSIVVDGHEWHWMEMADGVIARAARMLDEG